MRIDADKCSDDDYEVVAETSPRPRSVTPDRSHALTGESFVNLGALLLGRSGSRVSSPSGSFVSSPNAATVPNEDEQKMDSDITSYLRRLWSPRILYSRSLVFLVFFVVTAKMAFMYKELQLRDARLTILAENNQKLIMELSSKEAQRVTLVKDLNDEKLRKALLLEDKQVLEVEVQYYKSQVADLKESPSSCLDGCSTSPSFWRRMWDTASWLIPEFIKDGAVWLKDSVVRLTPDCFKDILAWIKEQGISFLDYVYSFYEEPKPLGG